MKLNRRSLLQALAAVSLWGMAPRQNGPALDKTTTALAGRALGPVGAVHRITGEVRIFERGDVLDHTEWTVQGLVAARVAWSSASVPVMFNGIEGFGTQEPDA